MADWMCFNKEKDAWVKASMVYDVVILWDKKRNFYQLIDSIEKRDVIISKKDAEFILNPTKNDKGEYPNLSYSN
jgi:hypothetical protein